MRVSAGAAALVLMSAGATPGQELPPRGPAEIRDGQLVAQPRLTLPAVSPRPTPAGRWLVASSLLWANSFSWTQDVAGEEPADRRFLVDGEALVLDFTLRRGLSPSLDVGLRVPVHNRDGGALDGFIDWWHRLTGAPDGERPSFDTDLYRVEGVDTDGTAFSWNDQHGWGLGDIELDARWRVAGGDGEGPSVAVVARGSVPTGTGPFAGNRPGLGAQAVLGAPVGRRFDVYAGAGVTAQDPGPVRGVRYTAARAHGFLALEWRPWRRVSLVAETNAASRLVESIDRYPGLHWIVNLTGRVDVGPRLRLDLGMTENIASQQTTTDFAFYLGLALHP